jgi:hypothetical protein
VTDTRHWRDHAPAMLRESFNGPRGEPCFTTLDRRWLWHLENSLAVRSTTDGQRAILADLRQYLHETCEHHMQDFLTCCDPRNETCVPPHRQCTWCNHVEWLGAADRPEENP